MTVLRLSRVLALAAIGLFPLGQAISASPTAPATPAAAPAYDFYLCSTVARHYIIGSKVVSANGLFRELPDGSWQHFGQADTTLTGFSVDAENPNVVYASGLNGCWRSLDGGKSWQVNTGWAITDGRDVAADPHAPGHVYFAYVDGLAFSSDHGRTWTKRETGLPSQANYIASVEVDRTTAGRVVIGGERGIYLTTNAGRLWERVLATSGTVNDVQQSPHDPQEWLAATDADGAWSSRDGGKTWTRLAGVPHPGPLYNLSFDPTNPRRRVIGGWAHGALVTEDGGATWEARNTGLPQPALVWRVGVHPLTGRLYASVSGKTLYRSDDFGRTWNTDRLEGARVNAFITIPRRAPAPIR